MQARAKRTAGHQLADANPGVAIANVFDSEISHEGLERTTRILLVCFALLLILAYWPTIARTSVLIVNSDDMAHALFAPLVAGYIAWERRHIAFSSTGTRLSTIGIPVLIAGAIVAVAATIGRSTTITRFAFLISLTGVLLVVGGVHAVRTLVFPIFLLLFTFPIPQALYADLTLPLQLLASRMSEWVLETIGYSVLRDGNTLFLPHQQLSVAEACSGIRSLITLAFFCLSYAYFFERRNWARAIVVLAAIPAAIALNIGRITATGVLGEYAPQFAHGVYHEMLGWCCFAVAFGLVFLFHRGLLVRRVHV